MDTKPSPVTAPLLTVSTLLARFLFLEAFPPIHLILFLVFD